MRYEMNDEIDGVKAFVVSGRFSAPTKSRVMNRTTAPDDRDRILMHRLTHSYADRWEHYMAQVGERCPSYDVFLVGAGQGDTIYDRPAAIVGIHRTCRYGIEDFVRIAQGAGFSEDECFAERDLERILDTMMAPYATPAVMAAGIAREGGLSVWQS